MISNKTIFVILSQSIYFSMQYRCLSIQMDVCANTAVQTNKCIDQRQRMKKRNTKMHKNKAKMYFALLLHTIFVSFCAFWSASPPKRRDETRIKTAYNLHQTSSPSIPFTMRPIECIFFNKKRKII